MDHGRLHDKNRPDHGSFLTTIQWIWLTGSFSIALILCVLAVMVPMKLGERALLKGYSI